MAVTCLVCVIWVISTCIVYNVKYLIYNSCSSIV
jgi:hypothetical protein